MICTHVYIYTLTDPRSGVVRYVGKTSNLSIRLRDHLAPSASRAKAMAEWLNDLAAHGLKPEMGALCYLPAEFGKQTELAAIKHFDDISPLLNIIGTTKTAKRCFAQSPASCRCPSPRLHSYR